MESKIKASELRIGNIVMAHDFVSQEYKYHTITPSSIVAQSQCDIAKVPCFKPIELTEQVLLKCGFNWISDTWLSIPIDNGWNICYDVTGYIYLKYNDIECEISHFKFEYIHQLQNLYFALTGREIEFKA